jgi:hypothetical protein
VVASAASPPIIQTKASGVTLSSNISIVAKFTNNTFYESANIGFTMPLSLSVISSPSRLSAHASSISFTHIVLTNSSGTFDLSKLDFFAGAIFDREYLPLLNAYLAKGIALPVYLSAPSVTTLGSGVVVLEGGIAAVMPMRGNAFGDADHYHFK